MIRIDSDSHFTPLDASDEVDPKYADMGPTFLGFLQAATGLLKQYL